LEFPFGQRHSYLSSSNCLASSDLSLALNLESPTIIVAVIATAVPLLTRVPSVVVVDVAAAFPASAVVLSTGMIRRDPIRARVRWPGAQQDANTTNVSYIVWEHVVRHDTDIPERHRFIILPLMALDPPGGIWEPVAYVRPR
jgi:hypothetical protein